MADCGESSYQLIENLGVQGLATAQLLRAEINSIDAEANTADITLLDECTIPEGVSLTDVEFWYHCEYSTGTLEDLAQGHNAFIAGDMVYAIFRSATDTDPQLFYIVGHVDIHGTKRCEHSDYVVISLGYNLSFPAGVGASPTAYWVTIYDSATGATLDLDSFIPIDDGSPDAPLALPCVLDSAFSAWLTYNFDAAVPSHNCPVTISSYEETVTQTIDINDDDSDCDYHVKDGYSDGGYFERYAHADWSLPSGGYYSRVDSTIDDTEFLPVTRRGWNIYDGLLKTTSRAFTGGEINVSGSAGSNGSFIYSSVSVEYSIKYASDFHSVEFDKKTFSEESAYGAGFANLEYPDLSLSSRSGIHAVGKYGVYVICIGRDEYIAHYQFGGNFIGGAVSAPCSGSGIEYGVLFPFPWDLATVSSRDYYHTYGLSFCFVGMFSDLTGSLEYDLPITTCLEQVDNNKSRGLEDCFAELKKVIYSLCNNTSAFGTWSGSTPSISVMNKKTVE